MFITDQRLEKIKKQMSEEYDSLFLEIQKSKKKSAEHNRLLSKEFILYKKSVKFINENKRYFDSKRSYLMKNTNISREQRLSLDEEEKKIFSKEYEPKKPVIKLKNYIGTGRCIIRKS
jgi:hypothetical protein